MNFILWFMLFCCLLSDSPIIAQNQYIAQTHTLSIADGLLSNTINVIYEDSRGVVWIGTDYGLNSYDGINLSSYTKSKNGLNANFIQHISEDIHGNIWVSSSNHQRGTRLLNIIDPIRQEVKTIQAYCQTPPSFSKTKIRRIVQNYDKTIWFISKTNHIYEYNGDRIVSLIKPHPNRYFICKTGLSELSFATHITKGNQPLDSITFYDHKKQEVIKTLLLDSTNLHPRYRYTPQASYWINPTDSISKVFSKNFKPGQAPIYQGVFDKNNFFVATNDNFLVINNDTINTFNKKGQLQSRISTNQELYFDRAIYVDDRNGVWFKDYQTEMLRYIRYYATPFKAFDLSEGNPSSIFRGGRGIIKLQDSLLFIGSILSYQRKNITPELDLVHLGQGTFGVSKNHKNQFWVACESGRAILIDSTGQALQKYSHPTLLNRAINWITLEDKAHKVWAGTNQGLSYLDTTSNFFIPCTQYNDYSFLQESAIFHIYEKGKLLYLCTSSGLYLWDKEKGAQACFFENQSIAHLYEDAEGIFWMASKGGGLIKFDLKTKESQSFTTVDGLAHNVLYAVYEDTYNNLWLSSNWGIMRFNKQTEHVTSYVNENGLLDNEFNTTSHYQDKDGTIYFGSQRGIVLFDPKDFQIASDTFPFIITQASKFNQTTDRYENILSSLFQNNSIELHSNDDGFQITAALLDYRNPQLHQYAYKIEGINKNWRYQLNPLISINRLPYGKYELKIKVKGIIGDWIELPQPIQIIIYKPFYLRAWFILLLLLFSLAFISLVFKFRTKQLVKRQRKLEDIIKVRTEKIAQQAEDLKSLDQVKSRFFANISHELRTPLTLILGPISFLLDRIKGQEITEQEVEKGLHSIQKNSKHLLSLVEEILDLSKMENNKLDLYEETVPLKYYVETIFESFSKQADYTGINYTLNTTIDKDLYLLLDENKVTKLLNNLLSNALKFTPASESVTFTVKEQNTTIEFMIEDTGIGIHPEDLPHIFERFYQSKQTNRPAQGGTGIGLALVFEFTQLLNGQIEVDSTLNKGTSFKVLLPKNVITPSLEVLESDTTLVEVVSKEAEIDPLLQDNNFTILLVEDHAEMRDFITQILSTKYRILIARNGLEGLDILKNTTERIDLIISDVMMPKMDGFEMLQKIKATPQWAHTPMIMLTARAAEQDKLQALTIGVDDYLTKPFSVEELKVRIKNLLTNALNRKVWIEQQKEALLPNPTTNELPRTSEVEKEEPAEITNHIKEVDLAWVKEVENLMLEEVDNELISISDFAQKLHLSERHLSRKLKQITGMSPAKMFKTVRLNLARTYLETGKFQTVKEVAFMVGFLTVSNFSKSYKKEYGKLPSEHFFKK